MLETEQRSTDLHWDHGVVVIMEMDGLRASLAIDPSVSLSD